jgi:S1-C subfamily serine protease
VTLHDGRKFDGRLAGADAAADMAVVKVDARDLPTAAIGDSDKLKVGEYVLAIGNPLGIGTTVTHGIVSATDRHDLPVGNGRVLRRAIQTDAPINRGNSGGALANLNGALVGINTAIASEGGGSIGIGFAIPMNVARGVLRDIVRSGKSAPARPKSPFIGIEFGEVPANMAESLGLEPGQGVVVGDVKPLTAAADAGLRPGDVIIALDGRLITGSADIPRLVGGKRVGEAVALRVMRGFGKTEELKLVLGEKPEQYRNRRP